MALTQCITTSYKQEILSGTHLSSNTYKIALYNATSAMDATTTAYTVTNEVGNSGTYAAGGASLATFSTGTSGTTVWLDFTVDPSWTGATITARSALIYNSSVSNKSVMVLDFGSNYTSTNGTFTVTLPTPDASNALLRFA